MFQGIINLLKVLPAIVAGIKRIAAAIRLLMFKYRRKKLEEAMDKAKNEKNTEDLQKKIGDLLD